MQKLTVIAALVVGAFLATSCSDTDARMTATGPTTLAMEPASFNVVQSPLSPKPAPFGFCPAFPPATVVVGLSVSAGSLSLAIVQIDLQFVDTSGIRMPQVTLPAPVLTTQFGSALVAARQTRLFPLSLGLGCGFGQSGTITAVIITRDQNGAMNTGQVTVIVR